MSSRVCVYVLVLLNIINVAGRSALLPRWNRHLSDSSGTCLTCETSFHHTRGVQKNELWFSFRFRTLVRHKHVPTRIVWCFPFAVWRAQQKMAEATRANSDDWANFSFTPPRPAGRLRSFSRSHRSKYYAASSNLSASKKFGSNTSLTSFGEFLDANCVDFPGSQHPRPLEAQIPTLTPTQTCCHNAMEWWTKLWNKPTTSPTAPSWQACAVVSPAVYVQVQQGTTKSCCQIPTLLQASALHLTTIWHFRVLRCQ